MKRQQPGQQPTNVVAVESVDAMSEVLARAGGKQVVPRTAIPGVGHVAYFLDTEQNMFGIIQFDPKA
jgi:predicted enzyme related to lactoylglutathione lyase